MAATRYGQPAVPSTANFLQTASSLCDTTDVVAAPAHSSSTIASTGKVFTERYMCDKTRRVWICDPSHTDGWYWENADPVIVLPSMPTHTTAAEAEAEAAAIRAHNAKREADLQQQRALVASQRATQLQQTAAAEALRHEQDAKARRDSAAGKAKEQEESALLAQAGDKFDADVRTAIEATIGGASPTFLAPSAPDLAVDPSQSMHTADSSTRSTGHVRLGGAAAVVLGNWFEPRC